MAKDVLAILCSDLHLSHTPPVARSVELSWYTAQGRVLEQLRQVAKDHGDVPILCAGDVFHKYNPPPELINFAIQHLPVMYCVAGQHDLPYHDVLEIHKSAFQTMVYVNKIIDISSWRGRSVVKDNVEIRGVLVWGMSWGGCVKFVEKSFRSLNILLAHKYIWTKGCGYPGAPVNDLVGNMVDQLEGYDTAVFGDNHRAFTTMAGKCVVRNCGCLIPRSQDERDLTIEVGLLMEDGTVGTQALDTSEDKWIEPDDMPKEFSVEGMDDFIRELKDSETEEMDYKEAIERFIRDHKVRKPIADVLYNILEKV